MQDLGGQSGGEGLILEGGILASTYGTLLSTNSSCGLELWFPLLATLCVKFYSAWSSLGTVGIA